MKQTEVEVLHVGFYVAVLTVSTRWQFCIEWYMLTDLFICSAVDFSVIEVFDSVAY